MKLPKSIRILGKTYNVKDKHLSNAYGLCIHNELAIEIHKDQLIQHKQDTLLHEVIHVINTIMDLELTEHQVQTLSSGVYAALQDNPKFTKYIIK